MSKSKRQKIAEQVYNRVNNQTIKLTQEQLEQELILICGEIPANLPIGPEGKCPQCVGVYYTGSPLCAKHLEIARTKE